jgi:hypothetical protein
MSLNLINFRINILLCAALLCAALLCVAPASMAEEKAVTVQSILANAPKPHEVEFARKGVAETSIEAAWERPCPYNSSSLLFGDSGDFDSDELPLRCRRWRDCKTMGASASQFTEGFFKHHKTGQKIPQKWIQDGQDLAKNDAEFGGGSGHSYNYALKFAEENWQLFKGRNASEANQLVKKKFWQWCAVEPLSIWKSKLDN